MQIFLPWINYFFTKLPSYKQTTRWILYSPEYVFAFKLTTFKCVFAFILFLMLRFLSLTNSAFFFFLTTSDCIYNMPGAICQVVYSYIFSLLSWICLSLVIICVLLILWVYYVNLRLCKSYAFLLRNYFPQMSSHTLIYVEYFLIMAIKTHLLAHNL